MHREWRAVVETVTSHYDEIRQRPIAPTVSPAEIREHLRTRYADFAEPVPLEVLVNDVAAMLGRWTLHVTHPRYFGLFNPSVRPASVMADTLVAAFNPQLAVWAHAPAACEIERLALGFLASRLGFEPGICAAAFTTGGSEANFTAVVAALTRAFPRYGRQGLTGTGARPTVYLSEESHHSFHKIAHATGIGRDALRIVPVDEHLRLSCSALANQITEDEAAGLHPLMVVATAGTTAAGIIDPLRETAAICGEHGLWFHVDAAWGGSAMLSPALAPHLAGIEGADSVTWDAHKWLSVPVGAGMIFCRHRAPLAQAFGVDASYVPRGAADTEDAYVTTMQWSRRFIGLKLFMALAELGAEGYGAMIDRQVAMGRRLRAALEAAGWTILNQTPLPVVCFTHRRLESGDLTPAEVATRVSAGQDGWISAVLLPGRRPALRACITSFRTDEADVARLVDGLGRALGSD